MKRFLTLLLFLVCSGRFSAGQGGILKSNKPRIRGSSSDSGVVVEAGPTGCLEEKDGTFRLEGYVLKGHENVLAGHDGDEVRVTGTMVLPQGVAAIHHAGAPTIRVKTVEILHDNNPAGQAPALGPVVGWKTLISPLYGLRFQVPRPFPNLNPPFLTSAANFVSSEGIEMLGSFNIPNATFAHTNFRDGSYAVFVNPNIHSEGACSAFRDFRPKSDSSITIRGARFSKTVLYGAAAGTGSSTYYFHTCQNGLCYEFDFDFNTFNTFPDDLPFCAFQSIYPQNERQLTNALLSAVRLFNPGFQPARTAKSVPIVPPNITSFAQIPVPNQNVRFVRLVWSTDGADFVRIHFPLIKNLYVLGEGFYFYNQNTHNFPPTGHADFLVGNNNEAPVKVPFSIEPFRAGVAYPKRSKTLILILKPRH